MTVAVEPQRTAAQQRCNVFREFRYTGAPLPRRRGANHHRLPRIHAGRPDHSEGFVMTFPTVQSAKLAAVTQEIIELIRAETPVANLTADSALQDAGLDSLRIMSLVLRIESRYDIELDADDADELRTVGDLARLVVRRLEQQP